MCCWQGGDVGSPDEVDAAVASRSGEPTAVVASETGSMMHTVIFEEFKGTANAELRLDRKIADRRVFPAIDNIDPCSTRNGDILLAPDELAIIIKLRKVLHSLESQAALEQLLDQLGKHTATPSSDARRTVLLRP